MGLIDRRTTLAGLGIALASMPAVPAFALPDARFARGQRTTGWLDFDFWNDRRVFLPARINGVAGEVMLDSGVSGVVIDTAYARSLGLSSGRDLTAFGMAGSTSGSIAREDVTLELGSLTVRPGQVMLLDLQAISQAMARPLNVLLGRDLFEAVVVELDFDNRRAGFHAFRGFRPPENARATPLVRMGRLRSIPIAIEGRRPVQAVVDLGNGGAIDVSERYLRENGLLENRAVATTAVLGVDGKSIRSALTLSRVAVGGFELTDMPAEVAPVWSNDQRGIDAPAYVGIDLISRFRIATDYSRNRLWLNPAADFGSPFRRDRAGLRLLPLEGAYEVFHVSDLGPARPAGFREGERIVAVDGRPVPTGPGRASSRWNERAAGTTVTLTMSDGTERRLVLADYY